MAVLLNAKAVTPRHRGGRATDRLFRRCVVLLAVLPLAMGSVQAAEPPKGAAPLSAAELLRLYGGKTWKWGDGGAYFELEGRKFHARTIGEKGETNAAGVWKITDSGKLCFTAKWGEGAAPAETCFEHMASNGDIYQRRLPKGGWYVFKHATTAPSDEYSKFVRADLVSGAGAGN